MDDDQPTYSSLGSGHKRAHGFEVFPIYKGTGEDFAKMFMEEEVQPTETELGLGAIYDDLECFGGGKRKKSSAKKKRAKRCGKSPLAQEYKKRLKKVIDLTLFSLTALERRKIYSGLVESLKKQGAKPLKIQSDNDLRAIISNYYAAYKNKKKK